MCLPLIPALTIASAAVSAGGQIMGGIAAKQQGHYEQAIANQNSTLAEGQARDSIDNTKLEAQRRYREGAQLQGQQTAAMAANGIDLSFGSAGQTAQDTAMITGEDVGQIYKAGNERTKGFEINAFNYRAQGQAARAKGNAAMTSAIFGAAGTALGAASQVSKFKAGY